MKTLEIVRGPFSNLNSFKVAARHLMRTKYDCRNGRTAYGETAYYACCRTTFQPVLNILTPYMKHEYTVSIVVRAGIIGISASRTLGFYAACNTFLNDTLFLMVTPR